MYASWFVGNSCYTYPTVAIGAKRQKRAHGHTHTSRPAVAVAVVGLVADAVVPRAYDLMCAHASLEHAIFAETLCARASWCSN